MKFFSDNFFLRVSKYPFGTLIPESYHSLNIHHHNGVSCSRTEYTEFFFFLMSFFFKGELFYKCINLFEQMIIINWFYMKSAHSHVNGFQHILCIAIRRSYKDFCLRIECSNMPYHFKSVHFRHL